MQLCTTLSPSANMDVQRLLSEECNLRLLPPQSADVSFSPLMWFLPSYPASASLRPQSNFFLVFFLRPTALMSQCNCGIGSTFLAIPFLKIVSFQNRNIQLKLHFSQNCFVPDLCSGNCDVCDAIINCWLENPHTDKWFLCSLVKPVPSCLIVMSQTQIWFNGLQFFI